MVVEEGQGPELSLSTSSTPTSRVSWNSKFPGSVKTELDFQIDARLEGDGSIVIVQVNFSAESMQISVKRWLAGSLSPLGTQVVAMPGGPSPGLDCWWDWSLPKMEEVG